MTTQTKIAMLYIKAGYSVQTSCELAREIYFRYRHTNNRYFKIGTRIFEIVKKG